MSRISIKFAVLCLVCLSYSFSVNAQLVTCAASDPTAVQSEDLYNAKIKQHDLKSTQLKSIKKNKNSNKYIGIFKVLVPNIFR